MIPEIKICGLSRMADIEAVNENQADYAGFVFYETSKRNVTLRTAIDLMKHLDSSIQSVAVCVSPTAELLRQFEEAGFDLIQIHGNVPQDALSDGGLPLWQAVNISGGIREDEFLLHPRITAYVVDGADYGAGKTFGWESDEKIAQAVLENVRKEHQFVLAGGLNTENVSEGIRIFQPDIVDISSGVEENGKKSKELIHKFIRKVREQ